MDKMSRGKDDDIDYDGVKSYLGENILNNLKIKFKLNDYTSKKLLPLYKRNTLIEKNGTTKYGEINLEKKLGLGPAGGTGSMGLGYMGDMSQEFLSKDRRYNHILGNYMNSFENVTT
jgi:hypothetical protein